MPSSDKRPINLDIGTIRLPVAAYTSILHRISGILVFAGTGVLLWLLQKSLSGSAAFSEVQSFFSSVVVKFLVWASLSALAYHLVAGCKHLLMDMGVGETREAAPRGAVAVLLLAGILILLVTLEVWIW